MTTDAAVRFLLPFSKTGAYKYISMRNPFVSVLIPSRRPDLLPATLESLHNQTERDFEVLVAHDPVYASGKAGAEEAADKLNRLASVARGHYLLVLADDDLLERDSLYNYKALAARNDPVDIVYSAKILFKAAPNAFFSKTMPHRWEFDTFRSFNPVDGLTALVKAELWEKVGGMDPCQIYQDWAFWYECFNADAKAMVTTVPLWQNRIHADQLAPNDPLHAEALTLLYAKYPELKRS